MADATSSSSSSSNASKLARVCSKLLATTASTKASLAKTLNALHDEGLLNDDAIGKGSVNTVRKSLTQSAQELAAEATPYGPCIQEMELGGVIWKLIHPTALIFLLSNLSCALPDMTSQAVQGTKELTIVVLIDEFRLVSVLRPDKG